MNIYDTKILCCSICGKYVGEIQYGAMVTFAKCELCMSHHLELDKKPSVEIGKIMKIGLNCAQS